ncbi:MAG TPA: hypothetical protein VKS01_08615 [Bryobacteraceae bacterium]|nr:hypothetical protein [Bryobacteraceae bacterium]
MSSLFIALSILGVGLDIVWVFLLFRGPFRRYPLLLVYGLAMLATTSLEFAVVRWWPNNSALFREVYWSDEIILYLLLFPTLVSLVYRTLEESPLRASMGRVMMVIFVAIVALPFLVFHLPIETLHKWTPAWGAWFNGASQILDFGGAVMTLVLWTALLVAKRRDPQLLTLSLGLGITLTGQALAQGLRHFIHTNRWTPDMLHDLANIAGMFILCLALWPKSKTLKPSARAVANP